MSVVSLVHPHIYTQIYRLSVHGLLTTIDSHSSIYSHSLSIYRVYTVCEYPAEGSFRISSRILCQSSLRRFFDYTLFASCNSCIVLHHHPLCVSPKIAIRIAKLHTLSQEFIPDSTELSIKRCVYNDLMKQVEVFNSTQ